MLALTENAVVAIGGILSSSPVSDSGGIRITTNTQAHGGMDFTLSLAEAPAPTDQVLAAAEARVFLTPEASSMLDDQLLDADTTTDRIRFRLRRRDLAGP